MTDTEALNLVRDDLGLEPLEPLAPPALLANREAEFRERWAREVEQRAAEFEGGAR